MTKHFFVGAIVALFAFQVKAQDPNIPNVSVQRLYEVGDSIYAGATPWNASWRKLLPDSLLELVANRRDPAVKQRIVRQAAGHGEATFSFRSDNTEPFDHKRLYLVTSTGISLVELHRVTGSFSFFVNISPQADTTISHANFYGSLYGVADTKNLPGDGGFKIITTEKVERLATSSQYTSDELLGRELSSEMEKTLWRFTEQYSIRIGEAEYVFVQWLGDKSCHAGCCEYRFSLYVKEDDGFRDVGKTAFGCDV